MNKTQIIIRKRVEGEIKYNDGEFADVQTNGIEGHEKNMLLDTIQIYRHDTSESSDEFRQRFLVGMWLDIVLTTEINPQSWIEGNMTAPNVDSHKTKNES
jgi:hypothetical protein